MKSMVKLKINLFNFAFLYQLISLMMKMMHDQFLAGGREVLKHAAEPAAGAVQLCLILR